MTTTTTTTTASTANVRPYRWVPQSSYEVASELRERPSVANSYAFGQLLSRVGLPAGLSKAHAYPDVARSVAHEITRQPEVDVVTRRWADTDGASTLHGVVSPSYQPVDTVRLGAYLADRTGIEPKVRLDNQDARLDSVLIPMMRSDKVGLVGEPVEAGLEFRQGCVGNRSLELTAYLTILICSNGMGTTERSAIFRSRHTGNVRMDLFRVLQSMLVDEFVEGLFEEVSQFHALAEIARQTRLPRAEMRRLLAASPVTGESLPPVTILDLTPEEEDEVEVTAWEVSQHINASDRFSSWASESRVDGGDKARSWLTYVAQHPDKFAKQS